MRDSEFPDRVNPTVSVIVPTYNRAQFIAASLESVLHQTVRPTEVIVVNDGSTDATNAVLEKFGARITVIGKRNGGKASALNLGLSYATGELIWIFDDDDIALPDALEKLAGALAAHPECGFAYGEHAPFEESSDGERRLISVRLPVYESCDFKQAVLERCVVHQPGLLVRRTCYEALGPFDESLVRSQDYEMLIRLAQRYQGIDVGCVVFHQRQHSGMRGTANAPVSGRARESSWIAYDRQIFSRIYSDYPFSAFLPGVTTNAEQLTIEEQRAAVLERCCVMARKGMWDFAAADFRLFAALFKQSSPRLSGAESATLRRFFGPYSNADRTLADSGVFLSALREIAPVQVRWHIVSHLLSPWLAEIAYCVRNFHIRYFLGTVRKCFFFSLLLFRSYGSERAVETITGIEH